MQPNQEPSEWQQPTQQPSQAPYVTVPDESTQAMPPVSMTPDQSDQIEAPRAAPTDQPQTSEPVQPAAAASEPVRWQATEYIHRDKSRVWFVVFGAIVFVFMLIAIFLIKSVTFAILVPVMAAATIVYAYRPPRVIDYTLSRQGLHINDRLYPFADFKSFGVVREADEYSIMLIPTKRFRPGVSVYFPEEAGEAIVDMLGVRLPMRKLELDIVDKVVRKLRI